MIDTFWKHDRSTESRRKFHTLRRILMMLMRVMSVHPTPYFQPSWRHFFVGQLTKTFCDDYPYRLTGDHLQVRSVDIVREGRDDYPSIFFFSTFKIIRPTSSATSQKTSPICGDRSNFLRFPFQTQFPKNHSESNHSRSFCPHFTIPETQLK
jgi:hypothetical protein